MAPTTSTSSTTTTSLALPAFPPERLELTHGGDAWVVVVAASEDINGPDMVAAQEYANDAGYHSGGTDCDFGAAEAFGVPGDPDDYYTMSVYLASEEDAVAALTAFRARGVDGVVALVQTYCLD